MWGPPLNGSLEEKGGDEGLKEQLAITEAGDTGLSLPEQVGQVIAADSSGA